MTRPVRRGAVALVLLLTACATPGTPGAPGAPGDEPASSSAVTDDAVAQPAAAAGDPPAAPGKVSAQGTVLQRDAAAPQLCLGAVAESYPPQCGGPEIVGWDWSAVEQSETAGGVTWGSYALTGTWDGTVFTRTGEPVPLSLYDAMPFEDPLEGRQGTTGEAELMRIQSEIHEADTEQRVLTSFPDRGFLSITVVYDDGTLQARMDETYGADVVVVQSALRPAT